MPNKIKIVFLGNCASAPTSLRNLSSLLLSYNGQGYLFDCPENTQQQIMKSSQSAMKINNIFITHMHGDHYFGLFGLLSSFKLNNRVSNLNIYVPKGEKVFLERLIALTISDIYKLDYKINVIEIERGKALDTQGIVVEAIPLLHSIKTNGYIFKVKDKVGRFNKAKALKLNIPEGQLFSRLQKGQSIKLGGKIIHPKDVMDFTFRKVGKKIAYLTDTMPLKKIPKALEDIDILVHESTFFKEDSRKAILVKHSFAEEVLEFSSKARAGCVYLTHISGKYTDLDKREKQLLKKNKSVRIARQLQEIEIDDYK